MKKRIGEPYVKNGWLEWPGDTCLFIERVEASISPQPLHLKDGKVLTVGAKLQKLGGSNTSSGFTNIDMLPGHFLEYAGIIEDGETRVALFIERSILPMLVGFYILGDELFHHTPAVTGRRVQTTACELYVNPTCGSCKNLSMPAIESGLRYCYQMKWWRWPTDEVPCDFHEPAEAHT